MGLYRNSISIWSQPAGHPNRELLGQVLHGERGSSPYKTGDYVEYGKPLNQQREQEQNRARGM
ncbi:MULTISPECIES: hypothetical protein [Xanthomonas]|uniref:Uncharacterized protein n=1 Tax=Xanthomonas dyei TaxID=743699 RepID=A0ABZ0D2V2_9XANT|nr:hypothetical protein [Xanthomonas dyei]WOB24518.1 hypothetical protein NYR99_11845 [Xanthomonas dyei]WOB52146.1 hypothetical protein NYR95_11850 [Xanthomonas dyei]